MAHLDVRELENVQVGRATGQHHVEYKTASKVAEDQRVHRKWSEYRFPRNWIVLQKNIYTGVTNGYASHIKLHCILGNIANNADTDVSQHEFPGAEPPTKVHDDNF